MNKTIVTVDCLCPPKGKAVRHPKGDKITLKPVLDFEAVSACRWAASIMRVTDPEASYAEMFGRVSKLYVVHGIESWTLVDAEGKARDVSPSDVRATVLQNVGAAIAVSDVAEELYGDVMRPLLIGASESSPTSPTDESTSPPTTSSEKPQTPSKPSSISTIPTADTEVTASSLDGVSSSSQSSASAA